MNEAVRAGLEKSMFILDEQITPYLLKLKDDPSFQETSARAVENFESQLQSLSKEKIEAGHESMTEEMWKKTIAKVQRNGELIQKTCKKGVDHIKNKDNDVHVVHAIL